MRRLNWKLRFFVLAAGLSAAAQAPAALITVDGAGSSAEFLAVWDPISGASYYRVLTVGNPPGGTTPLRGDMFTANPEFTSGFTGPITYASDTNFATFLALPAVQSNLAGLQWGVFAQNDALATIEQTAPPPAPGAVPFPTMLNANASADTFFGEINSQCVSGLSCIITSGNGKANEAIWGNNVGGNMPVYSQTGINNTQLPFYHFDSGGASPTVTQYLAPAGATDYRILSDGTLIYEVSAVPEASTLAMFAAGLAVVGGIARRRLA
jgi:hypothetical protein